MEDAFREVKRALASAAPHACTSHVHVLGLPNFLHGKDLEMY